MSPSTALTGKAVESSLFHGLISCLPRWGRGALGCGLRQTVIGRDKRRTSDMVPTDIKWSSHRCVVSAVLYSSISSMEACSISGGSGPPYEKYRTDLDKFLPIFVFRGAVGIGGDGPENPSCLSRMGRLGF